MKPGMNADDIAGCMVLMPFSVLSLCAATLVGAAAIAFLLALVMASVRRVRPHFFAVFIFAPLAPQHSPAAHSRKQCGCFTCGRRWSPKQPWQNREGAARPQGVRTLTCGRRWSPKQPRQNRWADVLSGKLVILPAAGLSAENQKRYTTRVLVTIWPLRKI